MAYTVLYIAASEDGFIADENGDLDWLPQEAPEGEDFGFEKFVDSVDIIAQGSRTFLQTLSFITSGIVKDLPYHDKHMYVFTHDQMQTNRTDVTFVSSMEHYLDIINQNPKIKRVWLLGGAKLIESFKTYDLIDECIIIIIPKTLYEGIALPTNIFESMHEISVKEYSQGIIERTYIRN